MTRNEIQKAFKRICPPRHGEKQIVWFSRLARQLGWTTERVQSLWKDERCKLSDSEGQLLRSYGQPRPQITDKRLQENADLREELAEIKKLIIAEQAGRDARLKLILQALAG